MVLHWERHRDLDVLANGLNSHRRLTWGPVEQCTPAMLNNFVSGMRELPPELVRKVDLLFPEEPSLLEKTRAFRSALATVPALVEPIYASREQLTQWGLGWGLGEVRGVSREYQQVLYPTTTLDRKIENSDYGHRMEMARLQVGEQPNWDWWIRRSWLEKDDAKVSDWAPLFQTLLRVDHPRQGLLLSLALVQARRDKDWKGRIALTQVLDSDLPIQDRVPLLLALGRAETGKTIPDRRWREEWHRYCETDPYHAQQALLYITAARLRLDIHTSETLLTSNLSGWQAALEWDYDERISLGAMNQWRQQHVQRDDSTVHAILRHVPNRLVRLLDGFNYAEQWLTLLPKFSDMDSSWEPPTLLEMPSLND